MSLLKVEWIEVETRRPEILESTKLCLLYSQKLYDFPIHFWLFFIEFKLHHCLYIKIKLENVFRLKKNSAGE